MDDLESSGDSNQSLSQTQMAYSQDSLEVSMITASPTPATPRQRLPAVYRGNKGSFHTKQKNPRTVVETNWHQKFVEICCNGDDVEAEGLLNKFFLLNGNPSTKKQAEGMISLWIEKGAREVMCREVFKIGSGRYLKILKGEKQLDKVGGGRNGLAISSDQIDQLTRFIQIGIPTELGYPCGHRQQLVYCSHPDVTGWSSLFRIFQNFETNSRIRKMSNISFYNHMKAHHPEFRLNRVQEDVCDTCTELKTQLKNMDLSEEARQNIREALADHGNLARVLRKTMRIGIVKLKDSIQLSPSRRDELDASVERIVDDLENFHVDDAEPGDDWFIKPASVLVFKCEDFAGNFCSPYYGELRPGADYYSSKLLFYCFVIADITTGVNHVKLFDERGMGKDADSLCSLRLAHHLKQQELYRNISHGTHPNALFQVM